MQAGPSTRSSSHGAQLAPRSWVWLQAELQADGVGDHIFLLRVAEACGRRDLEEALVATLRLNDRALAFARKVRSQLVGIVERRVWPLVLQAQRGGGGGAAREPAADDPDAALDVAAYEDVATDAPQALCSSGSAANRPAKRAREDGSPEQPIARCPDLSQRPGHAATADEVARVRQALAVGYAPHLAKRMPSHNGYRTLATSKVSVACAPTPSTFAGSQPVYNQVERT